MLGLAKQVSGHQPRVGRPIGDHQDLRGPGQQIDAHPPELLPLGLGLERIAGADQHVDRFQTVDEPERHGGQTLHSAETQNRVGPGDSHGVEHRRAHPALALVRCNQRPARRRPPWPPARS